MEFEYIKSTYKVPAEIGREIIFGGVRKGVIVKDCGNYIGVNFEDKKPGVIENLHPTWKVEYLNTFAKIRPMSKSQQRYREYVNSECDCSFAEWLGIYKK